MKIGGLQKKLLIEVFKMCSVVFGRRHSVKRKSMTEKTGLTVLWKIVSGESSKACQR